MSDEERGKGKNDAVRRGCVVGKEAIGSSSKGSGRWRMGLGRN